MGNTGGRLKKLRKSLRRMSLSRSRERLDRTDQTRRSKSLTNLSVLRKSDIHKEKSKSTVLVSESGESDEVQMNHEILKSKNIPVLRKFSSCILYVKKLGKNKSLKVSKTESQEGLGKYEPISNLDASITDNNTSTPTEDEIINSEIDNARLQVIEPIPKESYSEENTNDPKVSTLKNSKSSQNIFESDNRTKPGQNVTYNDNDSIEMRSLKRIDEGLYDLEKQMDDMQHSELTTHLTTFKEEFHLIWQMAYEIEITNDEVRDKKAETIDYTKYLLQKLLNKAFKKYDYRVSESSS
ncbi:uncharacterized protein LOC123680808 [Harmonia axyridis]|uniref:uncharacterized protein LOC123680808 n=1 Tax=Harmonia axyridis TaxID=115357 RepID=UPI001E27979F|nr:uncharacterized protein LOC123680808 [Harmonia axyridis]XP_045474881.1 uncharacterized protein LOC123680808 [Harmonia axyridis]XP_045474886.1 uncharacterized protein LOC123680808 [Harmonia axyridis]